MTNDTSDEQGEPVPVPAAFDFLAAGLLLVAEKRRAARQALRDLMQGDLLEDEHDKTETES